MLKVLPSNSFNKCNNFENEGSTNVVNNSNERQMIA